MGDKDYVKNIADFYLDPDILSEKEAGKKLTESGLNVNKIKEKGYEFIKKRKAELALEKGRKRKEKFENLLEEFHLAKDDDTAKGDLILPQFGYRKKEERDDDDVESDLTDIKLLQFMKQCDRADKTKRKNE